MGGWHKLQLQLQPQLHIQWNAVNFIRYHLFTVNFICETNRKYQWCCGYSRCWERDRRMVWPCYSQLAMTQNQHQRDNSDGIMMCSVRLVAFPLEKMVWRKNNAEHSFIIIYHIKIVVGILELGREFILHYCRCCCCYCCCCECFCSYEIKFNNKLWKRNDEITLSDNNSVTFSTIIIEPLWMWKWLEQDIATNLSNFCIPLMQISCIRALVYIVVYTKLMHNHRTWPLFFWLC